jgi:hypothetical protein
MLKTPFMTIGSLGCCRLPATSLLSRLSINVIFSMVSPMVYGKLRDIPSTMYSQPPQERGSSQAQVIYKFTELNSTNMIPIQHALCATLPLKLNYTISSSALIYKMLMDLADQLDSPLSANDEDVCHYILNGPLPLISTHMDFGPTDL